MLCNDNIVAGLLNPHFDLQFITRTVFVTAQLRNIVKYKYSKIGISEGRYEVVTLYFLSYWRQSNVNRGLFTTKSNI